MATNPAVRGSQARELPFQATTYLAKTLRYSDGAGPHKIGTRPAGSGILRAGAIIGTAFDSGTNKQFDMGTLGTADKYATDVSLAAAGIIAADEIDTSVAGLIAATDEDIYVTLDLTGTAATAGEAIFFMEYLIPEPR